MISLEVEVFQLHHLLWVLRYFIHRKRPLTEWEHILRESYETACRMVTRSKTIADLRWQKRMDDERQKNEQEAQGGGGDGCQPCLIRVPLDTDSPERLVAFDADLAAIPIDSLAYFMRAPQG